jgi:hypothetical protein
MIVVADDPAPEPRNCSQRQTEVSAGQAMQIVQLQHLGHLRDLRARAGRTALAVVYIAIGLLLTRLAHGVSHWTSRSRHTVKAPVQISTASD